MGQDHTVCLEIFNGNEIVTSRCRCESGGSGKSYINKNIQSNANNLICEVFKKRTTQCIH